MRKVLLCLSLASAACGSTTDRGSDAAARDAREDAVPHGGDAGLDAATDAATDGAPTADAPDAAPTFPLPAVPFHTSGRWILDAHEQRVKLASVNWYGAEEKDYVVAGLDRASVDAIAGTIRAMGFNSVRIPWSNEMYETNPMVDPARLSANPGLAGRHALEVLDAVIDALARQGLVVVLDNHGSTADWCCSNDDGNGLWYRDGYPESSWLADWRGIVTRYRSQPAVVGADLRNELRSANGMTATWGGPAATDWRAAAIRGGNAVLEANPDLLIMVEGLGYSLDFGGVYTDPVVLNVDHRVVYSPHDYAWDHNGVTTYDQLHTALGNAWGFILGQGHAYTAPIWIGEFGTCQDASCVQSFWFQGFLQYLAEADEDWCYWALNGTQATGTSRTLGAPETYGVLDPSWTGAASADLLGALQAHQHATQSP